MGSSFDDRVLVLMPTVKDGERSGRALLAAGIPYFVCTDLPHLCEEIDRGAAAALLTEEAIDSDASGCLSQVLGSQAPWSDFPLVVLARSRESGHALSQSMNAALVERPVRIRSLLSVVRSALRSRRHQYEVRDHLRECERLEADLRESDRKKDDFIALLAHELRNPLAPIRNGLQILQLADGDAAEKGRAHEMMERQLVHMVRLIDDLLDISRISRNKMTLHRERLELARLVQSAVETAQPFIDQAGHKLRISLPSEPIYLHGDHTRLAQVFSNLLTNSAKYTEPGGRISINAERQDGRVRVTISDTGIGIPGEALANIFDMFSQVDRTIERSMGGLGIGLALVKALVEAHGGSVAVTSDGLGHGAAFTITLPVSADTPAEAPPTVNGNHDAAKGLRILVVDDNRDGAQSLTVMLKYRGNQVEMASDGVEAIEVAEQFRPDVILMDVGMPRLNGYDATRSIRKHDWGQAISIIALTGWGQEHDREQSRLAGCDGHLVKPVLLPDLERELAKLTAAKS